MRLLFCSVMFLAAAAVDGDSSGALSKASQENKTLFIFYYKNQDEKTVRLQQVFDKAVHKLGGQVMSVKVDALDPSEKPLVDRFDMKRAPMPFVVVLAPNGAVTGGFPSFTEEQLMESVSSPGAARSLKALQDRKLVLLCLQGTTTTNNDAAMKGVAEFKSDPRFDAATEIVKIDPSDVKEHKFLNQLGLNIGSSQAVTVLISPPAEVIGTYQGATSRDQMVSDLQKAASGCCAGGCCPGGCCPGGKCGK